MLHHLKMHGFVGRCWKWCHKKAVGLLLLRVVLGAFFIAHGVSKFQNLAVMKEFFGSLGLWTWTAPFVAAVELVSGVSLVLGAFLWPAAIMITATMAVAIWKVTGQNIGGYPVLMHFVTGWGQNLIYAAAALALAFTGAGRYSLTAWYLRRCHTSGTCKDCMTGHGMNCGSCGSGRCVDCKDCAEGKCPGCACDGCESGKQEPAQQI